jgi:hypothetical protein
MSTSVDSPRGAGPPEPSGDDGTATDRFRAPTVDDATERFRAPGRGDAPDAGPADHPVPSHEGGGGAGADPGPADGEAADVEDAAAEPPAAAGEPSDTAAGGPTPAGGSVGEQTPAGGATTSSGAARARRLSRGLRVPSAPPPSRSGATSSSGGRPSAGAGERPVRGGPAPTAAAGPTSAAPASPASAPVAAAMTVTAPRVGPGARSSPVGPLPVGGPPAPPSSPTPPRRTAALGRLVLVLVLVAGVIGTVVVLQQRSHFGRTDAGPEEIPALEVAPAQVDLGTVGQPTALAPPSALLPGTDTARPGGQGAPTISAWANDLGPRTNIPPIALQAYGMADLTMRQVDPQCHLSWVTVAGLARIESNHGRYRGAQIEPNGDIEPRIVGVPLDGTSGNRTISDTDGGVLDGDPTLDRAVGPLQFIPSTWAKWRADGNNDGRADPDNIFDAALAAGRYLCAGGRDLASGQGWRSAVLSYNNSDDYGRRVYAAAEAYANSGTP